MKSLQKLILPILIVIVIAIVYVFYFKSDGGLGSFAELDPNNSAVKELKVQILHDRGISQTSFYAADKFGTIVVVNADHLPQGIESAQTVIIQGHLSSKESFHAHAVLLEE
jgi:hypothetical protein